MHRTGLIYQRSACGPVASIGNGNTVVSQACGGSGHRRLAQTKYRKTSNTRPTLDNKIVDHTDVVGASPVGAAPTTSSFST